MPTGGGAPLEAVPTTRHDRATGPVVGRFELPPGCERGVLELAPAALREMRELRPSAVLLFPQPRLFAGYAVGKRGRNSWPVLR